MNLAIFYRRLKEHNDEINQLRLALDLENKVNHSKTVWIESPFFVSTLQGELALALHYSGQKADAIPHFRIAHTTAQALIVAYPSIAKYKVLANKWESALKQFDK